jgi:hypothetical protein
MMSGGKSIFLRTRDPTRRSPQPRPKPAEKGEKDNFSIITIQKNIRVPAKLYAPLAASATSAAIPLPVGVGFESCWVARGAVVIGVGVDEFGELTLARPVEVVPILPENSGSISELNLLGQGN